MPSEKETRSLSTRRATNLEKTTSANVKLRLIYIHIDVHVYIYFIYERR